MDEYISRKDAIAKIREEGVYGSGYSNEEREDNVVDMITSIPAANVRPVVRGKWEEVEVEHAENIDLYPDLVTMRCGKCNRYHTTLFLYGNPTALMNFCPVCGANMIEAEEGK